MVPTARQLSTACLKLRLASTDEQRAKAEGVRIDRPLAQ